MTTKPSHSMTPAERWEQQRAETMAANQWGDPNVVITRNDDMSIAVRDHAGRSLARAGVAPASVPSGGMWSDPNAVAHRDAAGNVYFTDRATGRRL
jgi:hypothetical protein